MRILIAVAVLILLACSPESPMEPEIMAYQPTPVIRMMIMDGDTIYDANQ